ncbi:MAG TPA: aminopeptidase P family protein [Clostridiales bacterium]|nr:aminopeptidase P family protein [Clostridiales bacterium]
MFIPKEEFLTRINSLQSTASDQGLDAIIAFSRFYDRPGHVQYLCNHYPPFPSVVMSHNSRAKGHSAIVIPTNGEATLISDAWYFRKDKIAIDAVKVDPNVPAAVIEVVNEKGLSQGIIGVIGSDIFPFAFFDDIRRQLPSAKFKPVDEILLEMRRVKSSTELTLLRECARIVDVSMEEALKLMKPGVLEWEVASAAVGRAMREGSETGRLRVQSGPWSSQPVRWPPATNRALENGDIVVMDFVGTFEDYSYDITRTAVVGKANDFQLEMLELQYGATMHLINNLEPGMTAHDLTMMAEKYYSGTSIANKRRPGTLAGHDIGIEVCDTFHIIEGEQAVIEPGCVLCIEPGLYLPTEGLGVRVEEMVIVNEDGCEIITEVNPTPWR